MEKILHHKWGVNKKKALRALKQKGVGSIEEITLPGEIWKDIPIDDLKGLYFVSSLGRVYAPARKRKSGIHNQPEVTTPPAIITLGVGRNGYCKYVFTDPNKVRYYLTIHRLIASAFIPNPDNKPCVNHINGIKTDNRIVNLEWVTESENSKHSFKIGTSKPTNCREVHFIKDCSIISFATVKEARGHFNITKESILKHEKQNKLWRGYQIITFYSKAA